MPHLTKRELLLFAAAAVGGACLHFLYTLLPCAVTALVAPVNESLWEHAKLLYWPGLIAGALLLRRDPSLAGQRAFALLAAVAGMLAVGWLYHVLFQGDCLLFDLVLYVLMMALIFVLPHLLPQPFWRQRQELLALLVLALGGAILLFTFLPPAGTLFADLSGAAPPTV